MWSNNCLTIHDNITVDFPVCLKYKVILYHYVISLKSIYDLKLHLM